MAHRTTCTLAVVASVLISGSPLWSTETIAEVPFELYQHHLVVTKGSIGPLHGRSLLIDTGTIPSVVDGRIAQKLRLKTEPSTLIACSCGSRPRLWMDSASARGSRARFPPA